MDKEIFNEANLSFDNDATNQKQAFQVIADLAFQNGYVSSSADFQVALAEREQESTTGFKDGISIPHGKGPTVLKPGLFLVKFAQPIEWAALDQKPVTVALALTIPEKGANEHLKMLSLIARKLIDDPFRDTLITASEPAKLIELINEI